MVLNGRRRCRPEPRVDEQRTQHVGSYTGRREKQAAAAGPHRKQPFEFPLAVTMTTITEPEAVWLRAVNVFRYVHCKWGPGGMPTSVAKYICEFNYYLKWFCASCGPSRGRGLRNARA